MNFIENADFLAWGLVAYAVYKETIDSIHTERLVVSLSFMNKSLVMSWEHCPGFQQHQLPSNVGNRKDMNINLC